MEKSSPADRVIPQSMPSTMEDQLDKMMKDSFLIKKGREEST
jgi:hypothetical protein